MSKKLYSEERWKELSMLIGETTSVINKKVPIQITKWDNLDDEEQFYQQVESVFYCSYDGIYIVNNEGVTIRTNPAFETLTGIKSSEVVGRNMKELVEKGYFDRSIALDILTEYSWPGNVRELRNVIKRMVVLSATDTININDLPKELRYSFQPSQTSVFSSEVGFH